MGRWEWLDLKRPLFFQILVFKYSERDLCDYFYFRKIKKCCYFLFLYKYASSNHKQLPRYVCFSPFVLHSACRKRSLESDIKSFCHSRLSGACAFS